MATKKKSRATSQTIQQMRPPITAKISVAKTMKPRLAKECDDSCALNAYQAWRSANLTPAYNYMISFSIPAGKLFVIELVTASIRVPGSETVRLRMYTGLGTSPSNLDLVVMPQGIVSGQAVFVATHTLRSYADSLLKFNINRDNATTQGYALICVSGYLL
jgi:hypothetical protein